MKITIRPFKILFSLLLTVLLFAGSTAFAQEENQDLERAQEGKKVFNTNCRSCHAMERTLTGPALDGTFERIMSAKGLDEASTYEWLQKWIHNAPAVIQAGDPYAVALYNEYGTIMNAFPTLTEEEVGDVITYIRKWKAVDQQAAGPAAAPGTAGTADGDGGISFNLLLIILVVVLVLIALVLSRVTSVLGRIAKEKEGEYVPAEKPFYLNHKFLAIVIISAITLVGYFTVEGAIGLGRHKGYAPEQPIKFSHKLHAGINQIDCKYCHVGAEKGKHAAIPSSNICMNCHKYVNQGPDAAFKEANGLSGLGSDTTEIAKIYRAVGFDPANQTYDKSNADPIKWIKIHNLPDHVYFSHEQHVRIGKIECQQCHGPVQEMDTMRQFADLSMGWCISCHRETNVQFTENPYYQHNYDKYHQKLVDGKLEGVTVEMIGGTECQKCHY